MRFTPISIKQDQDVWKTVTKTVTTIVIYLLVPVHGQKHQNRQYVSHASLYVSQFDFWKLTQNQWYEKYRYLLMNPRQAHIGFWVESRSSLHNSMLCGGGSGVKSLGLAWQPDLRWHKRKVFRKNCRNDRGLSKSSIVIVKLFFVKF